MIRFWNAFTKITAWPVQWVCFRTKVFYEDREAQGRRIRGPAVLVSNHTAVFDYAVWMFVFFSRTLRFQMAEVLFEKKLLGWFLSKLGGIRVDRDAHNCTSIEASLDILDAGGVVGIFPESRLPLKGEERPIAFKTGAAYIALVSGAPVIPVYTDGSYFKLKKRARVIIGRPVDVSEWIVEGAAEKENVAIITEKLRERIIELRELLNEKQR